MAKLDAKYFHEAKSIASFGGRLCFAVSLGRDCACMLHIMSQLTDMKKHAYFTWSFYPKLLPYQARYVAMLEKRYGINIEIHLNPQLTKTKQMDFVVDFMDKHQCSLALFGYRMDESLQRRGMLKKFADGIDYQRKWAYPMRSFTRKTIRGYVNTNKIPLVPEYNAGMTHDCQEHRGLRSVILRHFISEEDYQAAISMDPNVEIDYVRAINDPENRRLYFEATGKELPTR